MLSIRKYSYLKKKRYTCKRYNKLVKFFDFEIPLLKKTFIFEILKNFKKHDFL